MIPFLILLFVEVSEMKNVGVILSGCGVFDGSEIHEACLALLYLDQAGAQVYLFAPDKPQRDVIDHFEKKPEQGIRSVLRESARIARGNIKPLSEINLEALDAIIFPGGFGAAKNLSNYASAGVACELDKDVEQIIRRSHAMGKVIGCICIAPVIVACALKDSDAHPRLTIGTDEPTMEHLRKLNAESVPAFVNEAVVDQKNRIVSTPAYMLGTRISEVAIGIEKLVERVLALCG